MTNVNSVELRRRRGIIARNKVLRQTYTLLAMNIIFCALCAYVGMLFNMPSVPFLVHIAVFVGLLYAIQAYRNNGLGVLFLFALTGFLGLSISNVLGHFVDIGAGMVVIKALIGTGIIFFALSAYVLISGINFSFLGGFLLVGLLTALFAGIGAMFFDMAALSVAVSAAFLLIFSGYVLYDTSNIIHGEETNYVIATLQLFINIFQIFINLLMLIGILNSDR